MSKVETLGKMLYGDSWQAQLSRNLKNDNNESIARQTVQSWHRRDILPSWTYDQLWKLAEHRKQEIEDAITFLHNLDD